MKTFKQFHDEEKTEHEEKVTAVKYAIEELQDLKIYHDFRKPVSNQYLDELADQLNNVSIEPEDIIASKDQDPKKQKLFLFSKSAPGCGMGKGALGDLRKILTNLEKSIY
jgi:hypothetical protein